eukprot:scaffold173026_cov12-Tisochrysis_lutea.AAC.1
MCLGPFKQPFWGFKGDVFKEAAQKGRVFEELVTDLSNVVSQQKLHIQRTEVPPSGPQQNFLSRPQGSNLRPQAPDASTR